MKKWEWDGYKSSFGANNYNRTHFLNLYSIVLYALYFTVYVMYCVMCYSNMIQTKD